MASLSENLISPSTEIFHNQWAVYQWILDENAMGHKEIVSAVRGLINQYYQPARGHLLDLGCGNAEIIPAIVKDFEFVKYIGVDQSSEVLSLARKKISGLFSASQFIEADLFSLPDLKAYDTDLIFSSYAVHHGRLQEKKTLFHNMHHLIQEGGLLVFVDLFLPEGKSLQQYADELEMYFSSLESLSDEYLNFIMDHIRSSDIPEHIAGYQSIARVAGWQLLAQRIFCLGDRFNFLVMAFKA